MMKANVLLKWKPVNEKNANLISKVKNLILYAYDKGNDKIKTKWISKLNAICIIDAEDITIDNDKLLKELEEDYIKVYELITT